MAYLGRPGATAPLTSADIPDNSITAAKIVADTIAAGDIGNDAVGTAELANDVVISTSGAITTTGAFTSVGIDDNASGAVAITIDSDEDVTLTSDLKLSQAGGILYLGRASDAALIHRIFSDSGNNLKIASDLSSGGSISFVPSSGSGTAMTLAADGNVGIGQPTPQTDNAFWAEAVSKRMFEAGYHPYEAKNKLIAEDISAGSVVKCLAPNGEEDLAYWIAFKTSGNNSYLDFSFESFVYNSSNDDICIWV